MNRLPQLFDTTGEHTSVIYGFWPDAATAERIAQIDGVSEATDNLHITLAFCGKAPDMTDVQLAQIIAVGDKLTQEFSEFVVTLSGLGRFETDEASVIWADATNEQLTAMNARARELLGEYGIEIDSHYLQGYTAHMTLAYLDKGADSPIADFPAFNLAFNQLSICVAGKRADLPLKVQERTMDILERLRNLIRAVDPTQLAPKKRDMMMNLVWENVWNHFMSMNEANMDIDEFGYAEYDPDSMHWFQELYVGSGGALFALSVQAGKLYRSAVAVTDTGVTVGQPEQVVMRLEPLQRTRVIARTDSNLPIFLSILATSTLNKANEIDTRALFDSFVERFTGETEYINVYHFEKEKSRVGKLQWIGRDDNLLLGIWTPDDNPVGRSVGETIEADTEGDWGVSIEFLPDDEGKLVEIIPGIEVRAFEAGELWGASVVRSAHACSWFTGHMTGAIERTMKMNKAVKAAIETLIKNPDALAEFETWVDGSNRTITDSKAITRLDESVTSEQPDLATQVATLTSTVEALIKKVDAMGTPVTLEQTEAPTFELDEEAAKGIAQAVFAGAEFRQMADTIARMNGAMEGSTKQTSDALKALMDRVSNLEKEMTERLAKVEQGDEEKLRAHDELKPRGSTLTVSWRAPRGGDEGKPTDKKTRSLADIAAQTEAAWNK